MPQKTVQPLLHGYLGVQYSVRRWFELWKSKPPPPAQSNYFKKRYISNYLSTSTRYLRYCQDPLTSIWADFCVDSVRLAVSHCRRIRAIAWRKSDCVSVNARFFEECERVCGKGCVRVCVCEDARTTSVKHVCERMCEIDRLVPWEWGCWSSQFELVTVVESRFRQGYQVVESRFSQGY